MSFYIKHPSDIPIEFQVEEVDAPEAGCLSDISYGGVSFHSSVPLPAGTIIRLKIHTLHPVFDSLGKVIDCSEHGESFLVRVEFLREEDMFKARMAEQACHIDHYKNEILEREGRVLSREEAALEWIDKYAQHFPNPVAKTSR
jgi:hypothetical protein